MKQMFNATYTEEKLCGTGKWSSSGHKERKRKICTFCRERIRLEKKCETLEVRYTDFIILVRFSSTRGSCFQVHLRNSSYINSL